MRTYKYFINRVKVDKKIVIPFSLTSDVKITGAYKDMVGENEKPVTKVFEELYLTGYTNSRLTLIKNSFAPGEFRNLKEVTVRGTNIKGYVISETDEEKKYILFSDTDFPIEYIDLSNGLTKFKVKRDPNQEFYENNGFIISYFDLIDEPKVESNIFIERGGNNVFETTKRLKTIKNLSELEKHGFNFIILK
jgi:hypothetical protein